MSENPKPSQSFMLQFNALKSATKGDPQKLIAFVQEKHFQDLAQKVKQCADMIEGYGNWQKYHVQVPPQFIADWKDYIHHWKKPVDYVFHVQSHKAVVAIGLIEPSSPVLTFDEFKAKSGIDRRSEADTDFEEDFNPTRHNGRIALQEMRQRAENERDSFLDNDDELQENYESANTWNIGLQAMDFASETIGIDLGEVFDRWNKVPSIFVPIHVSNKHGLTEKGSLYSLLNEVIRAYVAGAFAASIAMCRATLELVLKKHYLLEVPKKKQGNLEDRINLACEKYEFLIDTKLHNLRVSANKILHKYGKTGKFDPNDEEALLGFIKDLKFYIERAPNKSKRP